MPCRPDRRSRNHRAIAWRLTGRPAIACAARLGGSRVGATHPPLVRQGQRVHTGHRKRLGMECGHRRIAEQDDVQVAGSRSAGVEWLLGFVGVPLDRAPTDRELGPLRHPSLEGGHEPSEQLRIAAERALNRLGQQVAAISIGRVN